MLNHMKLEVIGQCTTNIPFRSVVKRMYMMNFMNDEK